MNVSMGFDVGASINHVVDSALKSDFVTGVASNPIYTALVIAVLVVLTVMFVFRDAESDESLLVMSLRAGFWVFLGTSAVVLLHNRVLLHDSSRETMHENVAELFSGSYDSNYTQF